MLHTIAEMVFTLEYLQVRSAGLKMEDKGSDLQDHKIPKRWHLQRFAASFHWHPDIFKIFSHFHLYFRVEGLSKRAVDKTIAKAFKVRSYHSNVCDLTKTIKIYDSSDRAMAYIFP